MGLIALHPGDMGLVLDAMALHRMDFDDAYQYVAAEKRDLTIVSFDRHFDGTPRGRRTPGEETPRKETSHPRVSSRGRARRTEGDAR